MALTALEKAAVGSAHVITLFPKKRMSVLQQNLLKVFGSKRRVTAQLESERWDRGGV